MDCPLITYGEYTELGYESVSEKDFGRFLALAESALRQHTFGRITGDLTLKGRYALCELIDVFFADNSRGSAHLTAFSNEGYSEKYAEHERLVRTAGERAKDIINRFFDKDEVWRGIG